VAVHIVNFDFTDTGIGGAHFDPTIHVGDTVEWVWDQGFHSTTSVSGIAESWDSGATSAIGHTFYHTFTNVGVFAYYCVIHWADDGNGTASGMSGIVHVKEISVAEPSSLMLGSIAALASLGAPGEDGFDIRQAVFQTHEPELRPGRLDKLRNANRFYLSGSGANPKPTCREVVPGSGGSLTLAHPAAARHDLRSV
jgi:plastocyanin